MRNFAIRTAIALFTAVILLLIQPVFWSSASSPWTKVLVIAVFTLAYFRPHHGLLVVAAFAPLGQVWGPVLGVRMRAAEMLVLSVLAGALVHGWTLRRFRNGSFDRLQTSVLIFGLVVTLSCLEQLRLLGADAQTLVYYATHQYLNSFRSFGMIYSAMLLLEGIALLAYSARCCRTEPQFGWRVVRMLVISGVAAALFNVWFFAHELLETGAAQAWFADFFLRQRWSAHVSDVNAAGSFFAMIMFIAFGLAWSDRRHKVVWMLAGLIAGVAVWMTASRTALVAAAIVAAVMTVKAALARAAVVPRPVALMISALSVSTVAAVAFAFGRNVSGSAALAMTIRWEFLATTWRMLAEHPLFGVGVGQYAHWSSRFSSPELISYYSRENAHNNFAQIAGELGLVGLTAFVAILAVCLWRPHATRRNNAVVTPVFIGLAAFILTWLGGHPLLVPEVAYPFWIALAVIHVSRLT